MAMQRTFAAGEIGPTLYGGADQPRYQAALKTCRNFIVMRHGGVTNRPGTELVAEVKDSSDTTMLFPFIFEADDTYVIEAGDLYFRFFQNGAAVMSGMSPLEVVTPYLSTDVSRLKMVQSGDTIVITHPSYAPRLLQRTGSGWVLSTYVTAPSIAQPDGGTGTVGTAGTFTYRYRVTAIKSETFEESLPGYGATKAISAATKANPCVVTANAHGFSNGDLVYITGVVGMTQLNGNVYTVANKAANTFELSGINSTAYTAYVSGGTVAPTSINVYLTDAATQAAPNVLAWTAVSGAVEYNVYLDPDGNGIYGFVGIASTNAFRDVGYQPDFSVTPPIARSLFATANNYPQTAAYYQQRLVLGGTETDPQDVFASRITNHANHTISSPIQDDDAVRFTVKGRFFNRVRHLVEVGKLVMLTGSGEWIVEGDADGVLRPTAINLHQQGFRGSSETAPSVVGNVLIYVQARGGTVRDLRMNEQVGGYDGRDLTVYAPHLFRGYTIDQLAFQQIPDSVVWCVRSDGALLGLTYLPEFEVWGWHRHDTDGSFESIAIVPEFQPPGPGSSTDGKEEDYVYVIVKRTIGGSTKRYVERFSSRRLDDYRLDGHFLDSFLTYNGVNATAKTVTLSTAAGWTTADLITVTASSATFTAGDVGNGITVWNNAISGVTRIVITTYTSSTVVKGNPIATVPAGVRNTALTTWSRAVDTIAGLAHLEDKDVSILANGAELSGTVDGGEVELGGLYDVVHVGLPITADFETLPLDDGQSNVRDKKKLIRSVSLLVSESRGIKAGPSSDKLKAYRTETGDALPVDIFTSGAATMLNGIIELPIQAAWGKDNAIFVRQESPLPLTILGVIPNGEIGG